MLLRIRQPFIATLGALAVLGLGLLPAEHVHVTQIHDGHTSDLVHRHFEAHHRPGTDAVVDHEDDDHDVQWLTTSFTNTDSARQISPANQLVEQAVSIPEPALPVRRTGPPLFVSVHDPPWSTPSGLRAPPTFLI